MDDECDDGEETSNAYASGNFEENPDEDFDGNPVDGAFDEGEYLSKNENGKRKLTIGATLLAKLEALIKTLH